MDNQPSSSLQGISQMEGIIESQHLSHAVIPGTSLQSDHILLSESSICNNFNESDVRYVGNTQDKNAVIEAITCATKENLKLTDLISDTSSNIIAPLHTENNDDITNGPSVVCEETGLVSEVPVSDGVLDSGKDQKLIGENPSDTVGDCPVKSPDEVSQNVLADSTQACNTEGVGKSTSTAVDSNVSTMSASTSQACNTEDVRKSTSLTAVDSNASTISTSASQSSLASTNTGDILEPTSISIPFDDDPKLKVPFSTGWKRLIVVRRMNSGMDIYYCPPLSKKRIRSRPHMIRYLESIKSSNTGLTEDNFTFRKVRVYHKPGETIMHAQTRVIGEAPVTPLSTDRPCPASKKRRIDSSRSSTTGGTPNSALTKRPVRSIPSKEKADNGALNILRKNMMKSRHSEQYSHAIQEPLTSNFEEVDRPSDWLPTCSEICLPDGRPPEMHCSLCHILWHQRCLESSDKETGAKFQCPNCLRHPIRPNAFKPVFQQLSTNAPSQPRIFLMPKSQLLKPKGAPEFPLKQRIVLDLQPEAFENLQDSNVLVTLPKVAGLSELLQLPTSYLHLNGRTFAVQPRNVGHFERYFKILLPGPMQLGAGGSITVIIFTMHTTPMLFSPQQTPSLSSLRVRPSSPGQLSQALISSQTTAPVSVSTVALKSTPSQSLSILTDKQTRKKTITISINKGAKAVTSTVDVPVGSRSSPEPTRSPGPSNDALSIVSVTSLATKKKPAASPRPADVPRRRHVKVQVSLGARTQNCPSSASFSEALRQKLAARTLHSGLETMDRVFSWLGPTDLANCRCVCSRWKRLVDTCPNWSHVSLATSDIGSFRSLGKWLGKRETRFLELRFTASSRHDLEKSFRYLELTDTMAESLEEFLIVVEEGALVLSRDAFPLSEMMSFFPTLRRFSLKSMTDITLENPQRKVVYSRHLEELTLSGISNPDVFSEVISKNFPGLKQLSINEHTFSIMPRTVTADVDLDDEYSSDVTTEGGDAEEMEMDDSTNDGDCAGAKRGLDFIASDSLTDGLEGVEDVAPSPRKKGMHTKLLMQSKNGFELSPDS